MSWKEHRSLSRMGTPPVTLKVGDSAHLPHKHIHKAKNASTTEQVKVCWYSWSGRRANLSSPWCNRRLTSAPDRRPRHASEDGAQRATVFGGNGSGQFFGEIRRRPQRDRIGGTRLGLFNHISIPWRACVPDRARPRDGRAKCPASSASAR